MEELLHYVWKHRLFPLRQLFTTDGRSVEIIDVGLLNRDSGPDFFNAKIKLDGELWVGNIEMHLRSKDWYLHHHDTDERYDNVILHVVCEDNGPVQTPNGNILPQLVIGIPEPLMQNYRLLLSEDRYPPCHKIIPTLSTLTLHSWMTALQTERLERKTKDILKRVEQTGGSWEDACFATLARNYGFGVNGEAFEHWASHIDLRHADHHRDDPFQIEALFLGQAGLLDEGALSQSHRKEAVVDEYYQRLRSEYKYLQHKFSLTPMDGKMWKFLRLRPQNFPYIRLSQLAWMYCNRKASLRQIVQCRDVKELMQCLDTQVTDYWRTHYTFGMQSAESDKHLSKASLQLLVINTAVPLLFAYGRYRDDEEMTDRALLMLEQLKAEDNSIVKMWRECGFDVANACDSQALIQLKKEYCDKKECLRCRIGYHYMKR